MKYTINGYSQEKLIEYGVDLSSSLILRVIADMYTGNSKKIEYKIIEDDKYMWCTYDYLIEQIPILGTERTLIRKIESLIEKKILKKKILSQKKGRTGRYLYISLGENYDSLTEYKTNDKMSLEQMTNCPETNDKMSFDQMTNCHIKDSSITDSSIIDSLREREEEQEEKPQIQKPTQTPNPLEGNKGMYYQEIRNLIGEHTLNYEKIARYGKPISRIRDVIAFAEKYNKGDGWITEAIRDDYKLEPPKKKDIPKPEKKDYGKQETVIDKDTEDLYKTLGI